MRIPAGVSIDTLCIHAGQEPDPIFGRGDDAHRPLDDVRPGRAAGARSSTTTRAQAIRRAARSKACLAALEGAAHGVAFGSGCAATTAVLLMLKSGDHVLVGDDVYGGTFRIFDKVLAQFGLEATYLDMSDPRRVEQAMRPSTRLVWMETPSNPMLKIFDVAAIAAVARARGVPLAVDNTFATPMLQRPLALGASLSVHSTTKYLNGHSDVVGGAVMTSDDGPRRAPAVPSEVRRRRAEPVRLLHGAARSQDARGAHEAARRKRAGGRRLSREPQPRGSRALPGPRVARGPRPGRAADERSWRNDLVRAERIPRAGRGLSYARFAFLHAPRASAASNRSPSTRRS